MKKIAKILLACLAAAGMMTALMSCDEPKPIPEGNELVETSIIAGIQTGDDIWGSGTKIVKDEDVYKCTSGDGWDTNMISIPVCFGAGDLTGYQFITFELDLSTVSLKPEDSDYPAVELKVANDNDSKTKVFSATNKFENGKAVVDVSACDFLSEATKVMISVRCTEAGTATLKSISKANYAE